jgi:hypothetical protein
VLPFLVDVALQSKGGAATIVNRGSDFAIVLDDDSVIGSCACWGFVGPYAYPLTAGGVLDVLVGFSTYPFKSSDILLHVRWIQFDNGAYSAVAPIN